MSGRAVEAAGDVNTLLLDKTGTITLGNRQATEFIPLPGCQRGDARRRGAALVAAGRNTGRALDRRPGEGEVRPARARADAAARDLRPVHRANPDVRRRSARRQPTRSARQGGRGHRREAREIRKGAADAIRRGSSPRRNRPPELTDCRRAYRPRRRNAAGRRRRPPRARRDPSQGHRQGRNPRALRAPARDGHQDGDDHRRQPADRGGHRRGSRRRRLPRRGQARRQDGADPARTGRWQTRRDDRRRHQRRAGAGPSGRRRGDEHRHAGGERSRQHGRSRFEPDEAHRGRRDRQAAPDHARSIDDVFDRQRRGEILRDHSGDVRRRRSRRWPR